MAKRSKKAPAQTAVEDNLETVRRPRTHAVELFTQAIQVLSKKSGRVFFGPGRNGFLLSEIRQNEAKDLCFREVNLEGTVTIYDEGGHLVWERIVKATIHLSRHGKLSHAKEKDNLWIVRAGHKWPGAEIELRKHKDDKPECIVACWEERGVFPNQRVVVLPE